MSYRFIDDRLSLLSTPRPWVVWIGALFAAKLLDAITTYLGIQHGLREVNPVPAAIFETVGLVPGLILITTFSLAVVVAAIELWVAVCRRVGLKEEFAPWFRIAWYLVAVFVHLIVASHNAWLIMG